MNYRLVELMKRIFRVSCSTQLDISSVMILFMTLLKYFYAIILPLMLVIAVAGVAANYIQIGFLFTLEPLSPKFSRLNPASGLKRLVSLRSVTELIKSLFKLSVVGLVGFLIVRHDIRIIPCLVQLDCRGIFVFICKAGFEICLFTCLAMIFMAVLDYAYQKWQYEQDLRMTKEEIKEEMKQNEGNPMVKSRLRSIQKEMARHRMMDAVPTADVVITNPTRLAIALQYDSEDMSAPKVVAKGAGFIAARIREIANSSGVPVVENRPLAQTLFKAVEIGEFIPVNLYRAVAEVLAYVYRLKAGKTSA
jgi:flagellar biosynthetic protein FlhB